MFQIKNRQKFNALLFVTLGLLLSIISYQNFKYPDQIRKTKVDLGAGVSDSDTEIQRTRENLNRQPQESHTAPMVVDKRTQVVTEDAAPMKLRLKRAPATKKKSAKKGVKKSAKKSAVKIKKLSKKSPLAKKKKSKTKIKKKKTSKKAK